MTGCTLFSHKVKLPDWGFDQQEVTCAKGGSLPNSVWYVEGNSHPNLKEDAEKVNYRNPGFLGKFWELQRVMWTTNAGLVESHAWDSRPSSWPILRRGINFWGQNHKQIYLIGNPLIWWSSTLAVVIYIGFKALAVVRWQRSCGDYATSETFRRFDYEIGTSVLGWAFHYFPFYLMQRQLFLHHYFPALYFAIITFSQVFDFFTARISIGTFTLKNRPALGRIAAVVFLGASIVVFGLYAPLAYGNMWTKSECNTVKLFPTWDWDCNTFFDNYAEYSLYAASGAGPAPTSQAAHGPAPPVADDPKDNVVVTPGGPAQQMVHDGGVTEEKVEFRDENGNLLDDAQVRELEGKVSFSTRYETRTRLVDQLGNEVHNAVVEEDSQAGTRAEGVDPETPAAAGDEKKEEASPRPPKAEVGEDLEKERSVEASRDEASPGDEPLQPSDEGHVEL
ncbi:dolichyl-phosphate-mannose-protein mannosyltransferase 1 [Hortaea werneckii]|nr:dolichyl-phosphate-mannose-protein mannosyltransferase 1 [Hortaea werneckii]